MSREDVEVVRSSLLQNTPRGVGDRSAVEALWRPEGELTSALTSVRRLRTFLGPADAYAGAGLDPPQRA